MPTHPVNSVRSTRRVFRYALALSTTAAVTVGVAPAIAQDGDVVTFSVTNFTDFHGHLLPDFDDAAEAEAGDRMGAAHLAALVEDVNEGQEYVLTTSGDNVGGTAFISTIAEDQPTLDVLNEMGVGASAVGNHEFDKGTDDLLDRIVPESDYPVLGANVYRDGERILPSHEIIDVEGVNVAFIGTVTQLTANKVSPAAIEGVTFTDPVEETNTLADELTSTGEADVVVALMHEDASSYQEGFGENVDVVLGGDSHQPYNDSRDRDGQLPLYYSQAWEHGRLLTDIDFTYDRTAGELVSVEVEQYDATDAASLEPHDAVAALVAEADENAQELGAEVLGTIDQGFTRGVNPDGTENRGTESTLNNLIAETYRWSMEELVGVPMDLGLMNAGGVRADLPAGDVTYEAVNTINPFGNVLEYATITGAQIYSLLGDQFEEGEDDTVTFSSIGLSDGVSYAYDPDTYEILSVTLNGEPVDPNAEYRVAAANFLFDSVDTLTELEPVDVGYLDAAAMADYFREHDDVTPRTSQSGVAVSLPADVAAGETIRVELSSLNYTGQEEPQAETVTVTLGEESVTADIDDTRPEQNTSDSFGRASVELTVPQSAEGTESLVVTTDSGTEIAVPVEVGGADGDAGTDEGSSVSVSSMTSSFRGNLLQRLFAFIAALF